MTKEQASLTSFFGGGGGGKKKSKQTKLNFGGGGKKDTSDKKKKAGGEEAKENVGNAAPPSAKTEVEDKKPAAAAAAGYDQKSDEPADDAASDTKKSDDLMDTDDEGNEAAAGGGKKSPAKRSSVEAKSSSAKKRRVIDDDSDEEDGTDDDEVKNEVADEKDTSAETKLEAKKEAEPMDEDKEEEEEFKPSKDEDNDEDEDDEEEDDVMDSEDEEKDTKKPAAAKSAAKKSINSVLRHKSSTSSSTGKKKSDTLAKSMLSNSALLSPEHDTVPWATNTPVPYRALCETFTSIETITARLEIQQLLTELFRRTILRNPQDMYHLIYLASNSVAPAYECIELGVGDSILIKAIGEASGTNPSMIKTKYESVGDLGTVASSAKGTQRTLVGFGVKPKPLLAKEVLKAFKSIATTTGNQSQKWKVEQIKKLLVRCEDGSEAKYIIRGLQGKLRIGLAQSTVLVSLAHSILLTPPKEVEEKLAAEADVDTKKSGDDDDKNLPADAKKLNNTKLPLSERLEAAVNIVKKAYSEVPSFDSILDAALSVPLQEMHTACKLRPGIPVAPMLAKPTKSVQEVLKRLNGIRFTCEYKYDGERAQVHMTPEGATKVFSRNLLDTSEKYPEVPLYVKEACESTGVKSFVLDTEVVAFNNETKQFIPFQVLSTRKKTEESAETAKVAVIVQAFDLMYLDGESLLDRTLAERRELMHKSFKPVEGKFQFATSLDHTEDGDTTVLEEFLDTAVKNQCEGLMVKTLDVNATYKPSERSLNWLKLKKDYLEGLGDSVDLVPIGAFHGKGKRTGVYGAYLLACYDTDTEEFQSVCKIGTGFSDEDLKSLAKELNEHVISEKSSQYNVSDSLECDVWFDAVHVWEVKAADLSKSSTHKGAIDKTGEAGRGIGLRFPRFERVRPDKEPEQATTSDQILDMYYSQDSIVDGGAAMDEDGLL